VSEQRASDKIWSLQDQNFTRDSSSLSSFATPPSPYDNTVFIIVTLPYDSYRSIDYPRLLSVLPSFLVTLSSTPRVVAPGTRLRL